MGGPSTSTFTASSSRSFLAETDRLLDDHTAMPPSDGNARSQPLSVPPEHDPEKVPLALRLVPAAIEGLTLHHNYITEHEECVMLNAIDARPWDATIRRRTQHYGRRFDYYHKTVGDDATPLPECLRTLLLQRMSSAQPPLLPWQNADDACIQCTVNEYPPGIGIAAHVDTHSAFEDGIASLTLGGGCAFRMQRASDRADVSIWLPPRSLLILRGAARYQWKHSISGRKFDRVELDRSSAGTSPADDVASSDEHGPCSSWGWQARTRRVSVTLRRVLGKGQRCACAWPALCDGRPGGASLALPTRLPQSPPSVLPSWSADELLAPGGGAAATPPPGGVPTQVDGDGEAACGAATRTEPPSPPAPRAPPDAASTAQPRPLRAPCGPSPEGAPSAAPAASTGGAAPATISERERAVASCMGPLISLEKRGYQWSQTAEQVRVTLSLGAASAAAVPPTLEACDFSETSCRLRVAAVSSTGSQQRFFFDVSALHQLIDPSRSRCILSKRLPRVTLVLAKRETGCEWSRLRA